MFCFKNRIVLLALSKDLTSWVKHFYRPQGKVMFSEVSVCSQVGGAGSQ